MREDRDQTNRRRNSEIDFVDSGVGFSRKSENDFRGFFIRRILISTPQESRICSMRGDCSDFSEQGFFQNDSGFRLIFPAEVQDTCLSITRIPGTISSCPFIQSKEECLSQEEAPFPSFSTEALSAQQK